MQILNLIKRGIFIIFKIWLNWLGNIAFFYIFAVPKGEVAEWSIAAVLKTVELQGSGGSNPPFSAEKSTLLTQTAENEKFSAVFVFRINLKCA
jgi:hypothetical protein